MRIRMLTAATFLTAAPFLTGCSTMSNTGKGALAGGAIGAGSGAIISKATGGQAGTGAALGGLAGALLGGAIGNEADRKEKEALENRVVQAEERRAAIDAAQMTTDDVIRMAQAKQNEDVIINQIRTTNSVFQLSPEDVSRLTSYGVTDRVIMEMQNRRPENLSRRRLAPPPYGPPVVAQPVYVIPAPPPPPPPVGFGVGIQVR